MIILAFLAPTILAVVFAMLRATILFWPVMILLGALSAHVAWIPALGWGATWMLIALITLLIPTSGTTVQTSTGK